MTYAELLAAKDTLKRLYEVKVSALKAIQISRVIRKIEEAIKDYNEALNAWIKREGVEGKTIAELTEDQKKDWEAMLMAEPEKTWDPVIEEEDLKNADGLSAKDIDMLHRIGILKEGEKQG